MNSIIRKIVVGSDHAGFDLKEHIKKYLLSKGETVVDVGTNSLDSVDYPDFAGKACEEVLKEEGNLGILVCGSGIGVSIVANKYKGIRCALVHDYLSAKLSKLHTNCNMIAMGQNFVGKAQAEIISDTFLSTELLSEDKYQRRIDKISKIEKEL